MTNPENAILRASRGKLRHLTRLQRMRNWLRGLVGLSPRDGDEPYELPAFAKRKALPNNPTGLVVFRRQMPLKEIKHGD